MLPRTNLNEQVYETLRQRVLRRDPGPGTKLSLHELASELGVSRSPVHHALTRLVAEGLLSVKARRGYYVTPVTSSMRWNVSSRAKCGAWSSSSPRSRSEGLMHDGPAWSYGTTGGAGCER